VSSGCGQWTDIYAYDAETGSVLGQAGIRERSHLSLHPSENWVFAADTDGSPLDIEKFDIRGAGIAAVGDSPYHGTYRMNGNVWVTPDGNHLITRGGDIFLASSMIFVANLTEPDVAIEDLSFNESNQTILAVGSDASVYRYDLSTWEQLDVVNPINIPHFIVELENSIYIISKQDPTALLEEVNF